MKRVFLMSAAAAAMILASCSEYDGGANPTAKDFSVTLSFRNAESPVSRADGPTAAQGDQIVIDNGYLVFVTPGEIVTDVWTISSAASTGKNIQNSELGTSAKTLTSIPGSSAKVYLIANKGTLAAPAVGSDMSAYMNGTVPVTVQGDHTKVTCANSAPLTGTGDTKAAAITLSTNVSRIQLAGLNFSGMTGDVAGIFINGFYTDMELDGTASGTLKSSVEAVDYASSTAIFTSALGGYVYDAFSPAKTIAAAVTPAGGVYGYNLFKSATPQIIIKLENVVAGGHNYGATPQFVTVDGFKDGAGTNIATLEGGRIYTIGAGSLTIKPEHLNPKPGVTSINVEVTVTTAQWQETTVYPNL